MFSKGKCKLMLSIIKDIARNTNSTETCNLKSRVLCPIYGCWYSKDIKSSNFDGNRFPPQYPFYITFIKGDFDFFGYEIYLNILFVLPKHSSFSFFDDDCC